jgi:hypothetical protein
VSRIGTQIFLLGLLGAVCLCSHSALIAQTSMVLTPRAKIVSDLSAEASRAEFSRNSSALGDEEAKKLPRQCVGYGEPNMAASLRDFDSVVIAIVAVTSVGLPEKDGFPPALVGLHIEQFLRGSSEPKEFQAVNLLPHGARLWCGGAFGGGGFYFSEPKIGDRYVVGYSFLGGDKSRAYISGGIDLDDHDQAQEMIDVQRYLDIEAIAGSSDPSPFVRALNDQIPWFRDLAAQRLVKSKACNSSPSCRQAFLNATRTLLSSGKLSDRIEGLHWTGLLVRPMEGDRNEWGSNGFALPNGLSLMSTVAVRNLLRLAVSDPSLRVADEAYRQVEFFDFFHNAPPGECIVVFAILRKAVRLPAGELAGVSFAGDSDCTPEDAPIGSD